MARAPASGAEPRSRSARLGFRVEKRTKDLVERAARLEKRSLTDFCVAALSDAARRVIDERETLVLSERDRKVFFETLMSPPRPNARLRRAVRAAREHIRD
jgi:uncharacterized protein (DUF1778 family)